MKRTQVKSDSDVLLVLIVIFNTSDPPKVILASDDNTNPRYLFAIKALPFVDPVRT